MSEELKYRNGEEKAVAFVAGLTAPVWYPSYVVYTKIADYGERMLNKMRCE